MCVCLADSVLCGRRWFLLLSQINEYTPLSPSFRQKKPTLSPQRKKGFTVLIHTGTHTAQSRCTCTCGKWQISRSLTQYMIPWTVLTSRSWSRHEPVPGASRRDATRTDSSFRVVVTSRLVAPTELDSRLHPFSRGSTCRPDRVRHQTPPRRLRIRLVDPSDSWVAPCRSDKVRLVRRRVPSDRARHVRLLRLREACRATRPASGPTRPTTSPVGSGSTRATPQTPRACRTTRHASGPTRPTTSPVGSGSTRATRQTF